MVDLVAAVGGEWPVAGLFLLGAFHGINPGMGWLFAVALAMQEQRVVVLWRALAALALGHALAVAGAIAVARLGRGVVADSTLATAVAVALIAFGASRLVRARHPRWGSMRVGFAGLAGWSFLMASAHGAGLMVLPIVIGAPVHAAGAHGTLPSAASTALPVAAAAAVHTAAYLAVTAAVAGVVYCKLGLALLRRAWINLDVVWAAALIATGVIALLAG